MNDNNPEARLPNRNVVLGVLVLVYISSFLDRQILAILLPDIKAEFNVSDTLLGLLTGLAFAVFYTTLGVPLARVADRWSRVNLLAICIGCWSLMTMLCGAAGNFAQLALARVGVGVGEAGCNPSAHSLIADYFPLERRATALSVYATAVPLGSLLGLAVGGWLSETYGWRSAFLFAGSAGFLLILLVKLLIREPPRGYADGVDSEKEHDDAPRLKQAMKILARTPTFRMLCLAAAADAFVGYGLLLWLPTFLIRTFEFSAGEVGLRLGLLVGTTGLVGAIAFGVLADRMGKKNRRFYCWMPMIAACVALVSNAALYLNQSEAAIWALLLVPLLVLPASGGPVYAAVQSVVPPAIRATAAAILLLVLNLVGLGFGPTFIGAFSDFLAPDFGTDSLRLAMLTISGVYGLSALAAFLASRTFLADLEHANTAV